jgi:protein associated with RNAse G/E
MTSSAPARFESGSLAVRRDVLRGKVRSAWPTRVVHDTGEEIALALWSGTELMAEASYAAAWRSGDPSQRKHALFERYVAGEWSLGTSVVREGTLLGFMLRDVWFSVLLSFPPSGELSSWYVNFEQPYRRTSIGVDTCDLIIDLVFYPDGTHRWKDEDEYAQGRQLGLVTDTQHPEVERAKDQALAMFEQRIGPFDERWLSWRRDPAWLLPVLPDNVTTVPAGI